MTTVRTTGTRAVAAKKSGSNQRSGAAMRMVDTVNADRVRVANVRFGSVELKTIPPERAVVEVNIARGRDALAGAMGALGKPGVKIKRAKGVPLYSIDPDHPDLLLRDLDGKLEHGVLEGGAFKVVG